MIGDREDIPSTAEQLEEQAWHLRQDLTKCRERLERWTEWGDDMAGIVEPVLRAIVEALVKCELG